MFYRTILLAFTLFLSIETSVSAQIPPASDSLIYKKVARSICDCVGPLEYINSVSMNKTIDSCIYAASYTHRKELNVLKDKQDDTFDPNMAYKLGQTVGMRSIPYLLRNCKKFFELLVQSTEENIRLAEEYEKGNYNDSLMTDSTYNYDDQKYNDSTAYDDYKYEDTSLEGKIKAVENKNYTQLVVTDSLGKEQRFICLYYFYDWEKLILDPKKSKGKKVRVNWYESELYNPATRKFEMLRVVSWIEVL